MKTPKEILEAVKELVKMSFAEVPPTTDPAPPAPTEPVKMMVDIPLADGTIVKVDKLEVGGVVTLNDAPAPDGEHKLADGKTLQTSGGVIVEISSPLEDTIPEEMKQVPAQVAQMKAQFAAVEKGYTAKFEAQSKQIETLKTAFEQVLEAVQLMGEQSKQKPAEPIADFDKLTPFQKHQAFKKQFN